MKLVHQRARPEPRLLIDTFKVRLDLTPDEGAVVHANMSEIVPWGKEHIGAYPNHWAISLASKKTGKLYFQSDADAMLFAMRWLGG